MLGRPLQGGDQNLGECSTNDWTQQTRRGLQEEIPCICFSWFSQRTLLGPKSTLVNPEYQMNIVMENDKESRKLKKKNLFWKEHKT